MLLIHFLNLSSMCRSKLECALFGNYVDELNHFLSVGDMVNHVVIVQFAKVKAWRGKF